MKISSYFFNLYERLIELADPTPTNYKLEKFSFIEDLDKNKNIILKEFENIKTEKFNKISEKTAPDKYFKDSNWNVFILFTYNCFMDKNINLCKNTFNILKKYKCIKTAMFSVLPPNSKMEFHRGPFKGVIRCLYKLKLECNDGSVGLQIKNTTFDWKNTSCIIFDDTLIHKAWNFTSGNRVVLFLDIERELPFPLNIINKFVIFLIHKNPRIKELYNYHKTINNFKD